MSVRRQRAILTLTPIVGMACMGLARGEPASILPLLVVGAIVGGLSGVGGGHDWRSPGPDKL